MPIYNPPTRVNTVETPFLSLVTRADPEWARDKFWQIEYEFSRKSYYGNPYARAPFDTPSKTNTVSYANTTVNAGDLTNVGYDFVKLLSNAVAPGTITTRTSAQMAGDIPGASVGMQWALRIVNFEGTSNLTLAPGAGVTVLGPNEPIEPGQFTDYIATFTASSGNGPIVEFAENLFNPDSPWQGQTLRQILNNFNPIMPIGNSAAVTFNFGPNTTSDAQIAAAYFGRQGTPNPYNFDGTQVSLTFGGSPTFSLSGGQQTIQSDYASYAFAATTPHIIAVYFTGTVVQLMNDNVVPTSTTAYQIAGNDASGAGSGVYSSYPFQTVGISALSIANQNASPIGGVTLQVVNPNQPYAGVSI